MAIAFARARYLSRSSGGNAVRSAAYNARESFCADRTGELFHFRHRGAPEHHEVLLPEGADPRLGEAGALWNAAEAAERRKDAQVARELVIALPADRELSHEDRVELARSFAQEHFVSKGLAVQLDVHAPHEAGEGGEGERSNPHAHLLVTTRRVEGAGFAAKKARDLDPEVRRAAGGRAVVAEGEAWGALWREHQDRYFREHGIGVRVDATAAHPGEHVGPVRMRRAGSEASARAEALREANQAAARDPGQVLAALTRNNATFDARDLDRWLDKHLGREGDGPEGRERAAARAAVLGHRDVLALHDRETGEATGRFTTKTVREGERAALADGAAVARARHHRGLAPRHLEAAAEGRTLRADQRVSLEHATGAGGLKLIEGRAGTGKSYALAAIREAHRAAGHRVVGLAPTNAVAADLKADGFGEAGTVHAALFALKNGRTAWDRRTVAVVDEAAMLDTRVLGELLAEAKRAGAKVILAGDDRQLASIERGGLFAELRAAHGSAEITEVTRQRAGWQREAARDLAEGRFGRAVAAFDREGAVTWSADGEGARAALVAAWTRDTAAEPSASRFVFAYTNADVDRLNRELRQVRRERGELGSSDHRFETRHGAADFAVGDRVQLTDTDKRLGLHNGNAGTITGIDGATGTIWARLDGGRDVSWSAEEFSGFRHGYAGTIYKGQGKTLDHTYLLHTRHWRAAASYVALTRQRETAQVFVDRETAASVPQLAWQMGRGETRAASVAWATADELREALRPGRDAAAKAGGAVESTPAAVPRAEPTPSPARAGGGEEWLIPPRHSPDGRDSLGRGTGAAEVARVVAADPRVLREREALGNYLAGTYRDPTGAARRLEELVDRQGWASAAARVAADPGALGELRGKTGIFAGRAARAERERVLRGGPVIAGAMGRAAEAETRAAGWHHEAVERQLRADATGVPRLTAKAEAAVAAMGEAKDDTGRAAAWKAAQADPAVAGELRRFGEAVRGRLGEEGVRALLRSEHRLPGGAAVFPGVPRERMAALDRVAAVVAGLRVGEGASARLTLAQRQGQTRGMRM